MFSKLSIALPLAASLLPYLVHADCRFEPNLPQNPLNIITDKSLCQGQGPDSWTFAMLTGLSSVGIPHRDPTNTDDYSEPVTFYILDNKCEVINSFQQPDCGLPYVLHDGKLPYQLTITAIDTDASDGYFSFNYGNGVFSIGNNGCQCKPSDQPTPFNEILTGCGCAFPLNGEPPKRRSITFEA